MIYARYKVNVYTMTFLANLPPLFCMSYPLQSSGPTLEPSIMHPVHLISLTKTKQKNIFRTSHKYAKTI